MSISAGLGEVTGMGVSPQIHHFSRREERGRDTEKRGGEKEEGEREEGEIPRGGRERERER